jgi:transposase
MSVATRINGYSIGHQTLEEMRFTAVRMVKRGIRVEDIAHSMRLNRSTVFGWMCRFRQSGLKTLRSTKAPGAKPKLQAPHFSKLIRILHHPATRYGFGSDLWTGPRVRSLIRKLFGITLHPKHMPRFLRRLGLVRRIPEPRALEQDPKAVREWKRKILPGILRSCSRARGILLYGDESLFVLIPHIGKTWTFPSLKPIIRVSGQRGVHVGVTSAVSQRGHLFFQFSKGNFNSKTFIRFVKALHSHFLRRKLFLIVDGAPGHRSKAVKDFTRKNFQWLSLHYLPSYSPELNPSEEVWSTTKTQRLNARPLPDRQHLKKAVLGSLRSLQKQPHRVQKFFEE